MARPVKGRGFDTLTTLEEARGRFLRLVPRGPLGSQTCRTGQSLGRVLARPLRAPRAVPPFDRAAMDGFALRAADTFGASPANPLPVALRGVASPGRQPSAKVGPGGCLRIATGAPLPQGANAVAMVEHCRERAGGLVEVESPLTPWENVSRVGEDVRKGALLLAAGARLVPADLALACALGVTRLEVARRPRVAVLSSGDELREAGSRLRPGQIFDANRPGALAALAEAGASGVDLGVVKDNVRAIRAAIRAGLSRCDALVVSGGTSVGARDFVPEVVSGLGKPGLVVHGVAMRPGYPVALGAIGGKPVVLLPGSPVAALLNVEAFVLPAVRRMLGESEPAHPRGATVRARATRRIAGAPGFTTFARVVLKNSAEGLLAEPIRTSGSGILSSLVQGTGLVVIAASMEGVEAGQEVDVRLLRPLPQKQGAGAKR